MNQLNILAELTQWPDESSLAIIADEGKERNLVLLGKDAQKVIGAQAVTTIRRVWQSTGQEQYPHDSPNGTFGTRISKKVVVALRTCLTV